MQIICWLEKSSVPAHVCVYVQIVYAGEGSEAWFSLIISSGSVYIIPNQSVKKNKQICVQLNKYVIIP